jgi:biofilm PGA synthesis N-glycosyltransferase PgaC
MNLILVSIYLASLFCLLAGYVVGYFSILRHGTKWKPPTFRNAKPQERVNVVIPVRDEVDLLRAKLVNVRSQTYPLELLDIIVVTGAEASSVERVIEEVSKDNPDFRLDVVKDHTKRGKYYSLNLAFRKCADHFIAITDVDVLASVDAIEKLMQNFENPSVGAVSAMEGTAIQFGELRSYRNLYNILRIAESELDSVLFCESNLSIYRKKLVIELPEGTQCDDFELTKSVLVRNYRAIYDPRVLFYENQEGLTRRRLLLQKLRRARANTHALLETVTKRTACFGPIFRNVILPFEAFIYVIAPILFLTCLASLFLLAISTPMLALFASLVPAALAVGLGSVMMRMISPSKKFKENVKTSLEAIFAFVEYNLVLFVAFLLVAFVGPQMSWRRS